MPFSLPRRCHKSVPLLALMLLKLAFLGGWIDKNPLVLQVLLLVKGKVRPEMFSLPIGQFNANARLCHLDIGVNSETGRSQTYLEVIWIRSFWFILSTSFTDVLLNEWEQMLYHFAIKLQKVNKCFHRFKSELLQWTM